MYSVLISKLFALIDFKVKLVIKSFTSSKSYLMIPLAISVISIKIKSALILLFIFMVIDFITGIGASYFKKKELEKENPLEKKRQLISSSKLKMSGVKFVLYTTSILLAHFVENIFFIKPFQIALSSANFTITILVISFWCLVEFYSIFFENFKGMGFDIMERGIKIIKKVRSAKKEIKN